MEKPKNFHELHALCSNFGWDIQEDNEGQIILCTNQKVDAVENLIDFDDFDPETCCHGCWERDVCVDGETICGQCRT